MQYSEIIVVLVVFGFAALVLSIFALRDQARIRHQAELQKELIAKFSSPQELAEFLNSDAGRFLIRGSGAVAAGSPQPAPRKSTANEVVGTTVCWGVLILAVGFGILAVRGLTLAASVLIALGIGFQINSILGYFFSKKSGTWNSSRPWNEHTSKSNETNGV